MCGKVIYFAPLAGIDRNPDLNCSDSGIYGRNYPLESRNFLRHLMFIQAGQEDPGIGALKAASHRQFRKAAGRLEIMRILRSIGLATLLAAALAFVPTAAHAQVAVGIGIGPVYGYPAPVYVDGPPVCAWGYYPYYPYACAPYGYYGPDWFIGGLFIGAGPWYHGWYGHPWGWGYGRIGYYGWRGGYGYRGGYYGGYRGGYYGGYRGGTVHTWAGSGYRGGTVGAYRGGTVGAYRGGAVGAYRGGGAFRSGGSAGFRSGGGASFHGGGGGFHGGGGGGFHGGGGHR